MRGSWLLVSALFVPFLVGCDSPQVGVTPANTPGSLNDSQIMGVLAELGLAELHGAQIVAPLVVTPQAKALSAQFIAEDSLAITATLDATKVPPTGSDITDRLIHDQIAAFDLVTAQTGIAVDAAWFCVLLHGYVTALDLIDTELAPNVFDTNVAAVIQQTRMVTVLHQSQAQAIASPFGLTVDSPICNPMM
jgi:hypothetical protein